MNEPILHPYADDSLASIYAELVSLEKELLSSADECRTKGMEAIRAKAIYDDKKHTELVELYAEEAASEVMDEKGKRTQTIKRTEAERSALYRTKFATERLHWILSEREYEVSKDYVKSLQAALNSTQTRSRMIQPEI